MNTPTLHPIVQELTKDVQFEQGIVPTDLTFVQSLGFMATQEGGRTNGGIEVVGFIASRNGLYCRPGGYPDRTHADLDRSTSAPYRMLPQDAFIESLRTDGLGAFFGNHADTLIKSSTDIENNTIELWAALVHSRVRDWRDVPASVLKVSNRELGRPNNILGHIRLSWSVLGTLTLHHWSKVDNVQPVEGGIGGIAFAEAPPNHPLPVRKIGELRRNDT